MGWINGTKIFPTQGAIKTFQRHISLVKSSLSNRACKSRGIRSLAHFLESRLLIALRQSPRAFQMAKSGGKVGGGGWSGPTA